MKTTSFRKTLVLSVSLVSVALFAGLTSKSALAVNENCAVVGNQVACGPGNFGVDYTLFDDVQVTALPGFTSIAGGVVPGVVLSGDGAIQFLDPFGNSYVYSTFGDGINITSTGNTLANYGSVTVLIGANSTIDGGDNGIEANNAGFGDLTITTGSVSLVTGYASTGIVATNGFSGDNLVITTGDSSTVQGGAGYNQVGDGISASNDGVGGVTITTGASSNVFGNGNYSAGIRVINEDDALGDAVVSTGANSAVSGGKYGIVVNNRSDYLTDTVISTGAGSGVSGGKYGIFAVNGPTTYGYTGGNLTITTGDSSGVSGGKYGVFANATDSGNLVITTGANSLVLGSGYGSYGTGISAVSNNSGGVSITTGYNSNVVGVNGNGITATKTGGSGDLVISTGQNSFVSGSIHGIAALNNGPGALVVSTGAGSTVTGNYGDGINANNSGLGGLSITTGYSSTVSGDPGIVAVNLAGNLVITTGAFSSVSGDPLDGIYAYNGFVAGNLTITTGFASTVSGGVNGNGIEAVHNGIGALTINTGAFSFVDGFYNGISATNQFGALGTLTVTTGFAADVNGGNVYGGGSGIFVDNDSDFGAGVTVNVVGGAWYNGSYITGNTSGILITNDATGGAVNVTVGNYATVTGANLDGITVYSDSTSAVNIATGYSSVTGDLSGVFVLADGAVTISNGGYMAGGNNAVGAYTDGGAISVTNNWVMQNSGGADTDLVISTSGGPATITNNAWLTGRVSTGDQSDSLTNNGVWNTEGISDFGAGTDVVQNNGWIYAGSDTNEVDVTTFLDLQTLNSFGGILLSDQSSGDGSNISDRFETSGDFVGQNGFVTVDAFLGAAGSVADVLAVGGNTSGTTSLFVTDTNPGPGAFNPDGILVVDVTGVSSADHFVLAGGPIDKGLFFYDLVFNDVDQANDQHLLVGLPDREVFETLAAVASAQNLWHDSADAWSDRQTSLRDMVYNGCMVQAVADPPLESSCSSESGLWLSLRGSWTERDWDAGYSFLNQSYDFDLSYNQDITGIVGGADFGTNLDGGGQVLFGLLAGYMASDLDFDVGGTSIEIDGLTFGAYASLLKGGFFANMLGKVDIMEMDYSARSLGAFGSSDSADVTSYGMRADAGYHVDMGQAFIEPLVSLAIVSTEVDDFSIGGASVELGSNESMRAGAGARFGFKGDMLTASITGRAWYEFADANEVTIVSAGPDLGLSDDGLEGMFGEVAGQIDLNVSENATIFVNGALEFNEDIHKASITGGFTWTW